MNSISEKFSESNKKILISKLEYDVDNNSDSLRLSIKNYFSLNSEKLGKKISTLFNNHAISYTMQDLTECCCNEEDLLFEKCSGLLDAKSKMIKSNLDEQEELFGEVIDQSTEDFRTKFELLLDSEILINFKTDVVKRFDFDEKTSLHSFEDILNKYKTDLNSRILDVISFRDSSLKNITHETRMKYLDLIDKTDDVMKKIKKESKN